MGLWGNLASLSGLGPDDPGSNSPFSEALYLSATGAEKVRAAPYYITVLRWQRQKLKN